MKWTDLFIRRPVAAVVVNLVIVILGLQAVWRLNVRQYPESENASITITTVYVGAGADLVRGFVTVPLERAISEADGIDYVESQSMLGVSLIKARLHLNQDATEALAQVSAKVDQVRGELPPEVEIPVINIESADSEFASMYLSFASEKLKQNQITDYLLRSVQPRLAALAGVQRAEILGGRTFAMRIWLDAARMAALNLSPAEVRVALAQNNFLAPVGRTKGSLIQVNLTANTNLNTVREFEKLVIRHEGGALVRLQDVARVELGAENYDTEVRFSGKTAVFMGVFVLPNANALEVIARVQEEMKAIKADLPPDLDGVIAYDATKYIEDALTEVTTTMAETLAIVIFVIFLFLGSIRSVLVPVVAIPVSLIGAVFLMQAFGFTVNLLTLLAIVLSVGIVVDDAIVMVENVDRHLSRGKTPLEAGIIAARELAGPVISMTLTLAAVYAPIGLQGGLTGALFREFAFTLAGAVLISGIVALTLSPIMSAKLLKKGDTEKGIPGWINRGFNWLKDIYGKMLDQTLAARPAMFTLWIGFSLAGVIMYSMSAKELAPTEDQGVIFGIIETPANSTLDQVSHYAQQVEDEFMSFEETGFAFQLVNPTGGFAGMGLLPWSERSRSAFEILPEVQMKLFQVPGIRVFPVLPPALPGGGQFPVEFVLASTVETERILEVVQELQAKAIESGMFAFPPIIDVKLDQPQSEFMIDREKVAHLGLNLASVGGDLAAAVGGNFVNRFDVAGRSYKVIPQIERAERLTAEQLRNLYVTGPDGRLVPLSTVAELNDQVKPRSLNRFQQLNAVKLSGVAVRPLDVALRFLEEEAAKLMPPGYVIDYTGESRQLRKEGSTFLFSFTLAVVLIFLILAAQFNSFRDPFVILFGSVPLAMFGALIFTFLKMPNPNLPYWTDGWTTTLNVYSQVGLVTLIGLVAKNGILIVEFANQLQETGYDKLSAIQQAARTRLRPVLMTTVATVVGHFPLTLVEGPGAEARNSIGLVLVGGMSIGTLFTLFIVPSIYMLIARSRSEEVVEEERVSPALQPSLV
ncbi:MAG: efflux RND transporter permease subunit [Myxococcales bacterium]|nr:efflux RND transporter permease subunit [Myxococcales bacterium]